MMILSKPSVSPYLTKALSNLKEPVILEEGGLKVPMRPALNLMSVDQLRADPKKAYHSLLLTSSENALSLLYRVIPHDDRVLKARIFKDKAEFRRAIAHQFPEFFFREVPLSELDAIDPATVPWPAVLKPSVGISSIGVYCVADASEWPTAVRFLREDLEKYQRNYSANVVEAQTVILEQWISGVELAIDGYYDADSEPVVLNILEHLFAGSGDTSDRIYYTRRSLLRRHLQPMLAFLRRFGDAFDLKRFPFHLEVRVTPDGHMIPIELNPLRFAGLGTTEIAEFAYGINVYEKFFRQERPDWDRILTDEDDSVYTFMCADLPTEAFRKEGLQVLDRKLFKAFEEVLEYRVLDEEETSTFAVVFFRSKDLTENQRLLYMDFNEFVAF